MVKCIVKGCSVRPEAFFGNRCPDHAREWLDTLTPDQKREALGPTLGLPRFQEYPPPPELIGKIIFLDDCRPGGVPKVWDGTPRKKK